MSLFSQYVPFKIQLEKYLENCKTVFKEINDTTSWSLVDGFIKDFENQRYNITIVGSYNRGKSTLLNSLMERNNDHISPISSNACTSAIIKYLDKELAVTDDKKEKAIVYYDIPDTPASTIALPQLKNYVTEELNPDNKKHVHSVEVYGDFPQWSKAATIIDSPGQNSVFKHHDTLLRDFIPYTDAIIFLVSADIPLDSGDLALLKELTQEDRKKIFFVLTKTDNIDNPDDLEDVKTFVLSKIQDSGLMCDKLYAVAAKPVYEALKQNASPQDIEALKANNGIAELENDLGAFIIENSDQTKIMRARIENLVKMTKDSCNQYISLTNKILSNKQFDLTRLEAEKNELIDANEVLRINTKKALRKFDREWERTLSRFNLKFSSKSGAIEEKIIDKLNHGGLIGAVFQSFKLKNEVQKAVTLELNPLVIDLKDKLDEVITTLNKEFDDDLDLFVRQKNGTDGKSAIGSLVTGVAMTGTAGWGISASIGAVKAATVAFGTWQTAAAAMTSATAANTVSSVGFIPKAIGWLFGTGKASEVAIACETATANAANAATSAIVAGISAVVTVGVSIAVTLIVQKLLQMLLVGYQSSRVTGISDQIMKEMEESIFKSLNIYKNAIITDYQQRIEDIISDNTERLEEIKEIVANDNPEERFAITERLQKTQKLIESGIDLQKQLPLLS